MSSMPLKTTVGLGITSWGNHFTLSRPTMRLHGVCTLIVFSAAFALATTTTVEADLTGSGHAPFVVDLFSDKHGDYYYTKVDIGHSRDIPLKLDTGSSKTWVSTAAGGGNAVYHGCEGSSPTVEKLEPACTRTAEYVQYHSEVGVRNMTGFLTGDFVTLSGLAAGGPGSVKTPFIFMRTTQKRTGVREYSGILGMNMGVAMGWEVPSEWGPYKTGQEIPSFMEAMKILKTVPSPVVTFITDKSLARTAGAVGSLVFGGIPTLPAKSMASVRSINSAKWIVRVVDILYKGKSVGGGLCPKPPYKRFGFSCKALVDSGWAGMAATGAQGKVNFISALKAALQIPIDCVGVEDLAPLTVVLDKEGDGSNGTVEVQIPPEHLVNTRDATGARRCTMAIHYYNPTDYRFNMVFGTMFFKALGAVGFDFDSQSVLVQE